MSFSVSWDLLEKRRDTAEPSTLIPDSLYLHNVFFECCTILKKRTRFLTWSLMFPISSLWHSMKLAAVLPTNSKGHYCGKFTQQFSPLLHQPYIFHTLLLTSLSLVRSSQTYIRKRVQSLWYPDFIHKFNGTSAANHRRY